MKKINVKADKKLIISAGIFIVIIFTFLFLIANVSVVSAQFASSSSGSEFTTGRGSAAFSNVQKFQPGFNFYSGREEIRGAVWSSLFDNSQELREVCTDRKDFALNIAPGGCKPMVVRSDLLAEQDVAVFCQLSAMQINPAIRPENIKNIILNHVGNYSSGVSGIAYYHPARIFLSPYKTRQGYPSYDNIGYAIIRLKRQYNESGLPDFVQGTLSARIQYDIPYGFGFGMTEKTISLMSDEEWAARYPENVFLNGKAFMRVEALEAGRVKIGIYSDKEHKIDSFVLEKGKPIEKYLPGQGGYYCGLGYKATYVSGEIPKDKATIIFDKDKIDVYSGDKIADGLCTIGLITSFGGGTGQVSGNCRAYNGASQGFTLKLGFNNVLLDFLGSDKAGYSIGSLLYEGSGVISGTDTRDANKKIYLGTIGKYKSGGDFVVLIGLNDGEKFDNFKEQIKAYAEKVINNGEIKEENAGNPIIAVKHGEQINFQGKAIKFSGFGGSVSGVQAGDSEFDGFFESAIDGYKNVEENYADREFDSGIDIGKSYKTYGIAALTKAIQLASGVGKRGVLIELTNLFNEKYPNENVELLNNVNIDSTGANVVINLNGDDSHVITLVSVSSPAKDKNGVSVLLDNSPRDVLAGKYIMPANFSGNNDKSSIKLETFDESKISASGNCYANNGFTTQKIEIYIGSEANLCGHSVRVQNINLQMEAKIRLDPIVNEAGSLVNMSYKIGIEKRAFPLNPAKTSERIKKLNESIAKWQNISDSLGKVVSGMKAACFVTSTALQVKNLFSNLGGKAIARQEVMKGEGGWDKMCSAALATEGKKPTLEFEKFMAPGPYNSLDDCYGKNAKAIDDDVEYLTNKIKAQNEQIKNIQDGSKTKKGIDTEAARKKYVEVVNRKLIENSGMIIKENPSDDKSKEIKLSEIKDKISEESFSELRNIELYLSTINDASPALKNQAESKLYNVLNEIKQSSLNLREANSVIKLAGESGQFAGVPSVTLPNLPRGVSAELYKGAKLDEDVAIIENDFITENELKRGTGIQIVFDEKGNQYYASLQPASGGRFTIDRVFKINKEDGKIGEEVSDTPIEDGDKKITLAEKLRGQHPQFQEISGDSYNNVFTEEPFVRYYETEPYKGMPALVPFDTRNGWYAATKQTLPAFGNIAAFQESGRVSSFWLCNVGKNGRVEFDKGVGDDICQMINVFTGQTTNAFYGLSESEARKKISDAQRAIDDAASQYKSGVTRVNILGKSIKVGNPMANQPGSQCQDFMSPSDCKILFNVCDPVICPSSRCNLGGKYQVDDVVQTGIVGSLFLCLPNIKEGIVIPICLTGVHAGVDNYVSILRASRDCLQENLDTGGYIGICDEITAIYTCEFFWRQAGPIIKVIIPKLLEFAVGGGTRGGGEYMNVQAAWGNMQNSINYFNNNYAKNAIAAFRVRSTQEAGTPICKAFVSTQFPKKFKTLIEPDSPVQFSAWFDEIKMTTATIPATSQYKVFFHIYAGKDQGAYYSIYLKDSPGESFITSTSSVIFATGFVSRGEYIDQAVDKTAPAGFRQLCVRINTQENCGFKQVSTSFALNYVRDKYIEQEATNTNIKSERECISGTSNALTMLNPNLEAGTQETLNPQIYSRGIIRICATDDPGKTTEAGRWQAVGYCDEQKIKCWLDKTSINDAITPGNAGARNKTLNELNSEIDKYAQIQRDKLLEDGDAFEKFNIIEREILKMTDNSKNFEIMKTDRDIIFARFNELDSKYALSDKQKARILFDKSYVNELLAREKWKQIEAERQRVREEKEQTTAGGKTCNDLGGIPQDYQCDLTSQDDLTSSVTNPSNFASQDMYCCKLKSSATGITQPISVDAKSLGNLMIYVRDNYDKFRGSDNRKCSCGTNCQSYANSIITYSQSSGADPLLVLALMMQESSCVSGLKSSADCQGLMQICSFGMCKDIGTELEITNNNDKNIQCGVSILKQYYDTADNTYQNQLINNKCNTRSDYSQLKAFTGWDKALRLYNGLGCQSKNYDATFVSATNYRYNTLKKIALDNNFVSSTQITPASSNSFVPGQNAANDALRANIAKMIMTVPYDAESNRALDYTSCDFAKDNQGNPIGGVILMSGHIKSESQVKTLITDCKKKGVKIISSDVEGGSVNRLKSLGVGYQFDYPFILGGTDITRITARTIGEKMKILGFNLDLAPVLDLSNPQGFIGKDRRSFGIDESDASLKGMAFIQGLHDGKIGATAKHFPGYGSNTGDSDLSTSSVYDQRTLDQLKDKDLVPFNFVKDEVDAIMMNNIIYSKIDKDNPAVFSSEIVEMARNSFNGIIITDDLNARSVDKANNECEDDKINAVKAVKAGNDIILNVNGKCVNDIVNAIFDAAKNNNDLKTQIATSVKRINTFSSKYP